MFDVSFTELMVIGVVALIVIGPERLPRVARTAGHLMGRLQRYVSTVKADINREMHLEDIKRFEQTIRSEVGSIGSSVRHEIHEVESAAHQTIRSAMADPGAAPPPQAGIDAAGASVPNPTAASPSLEFDDSVPPPARPPADAAPG